MFLGGTVNDVAQVVGAGFSAGSKAGATTTLVKLIRVSMLASGVLGLSVVIRVGGLADHGNGLHAPLLPGFVVGFRVPAMLNSLSLIPVPLSDIAGGLSRFCLLVAIAAVGIGPASRALASGATEAPPIA